MSQLKKKLAEITNLIRTSYEELGLMTTILNTRVIQQKSLAEEMLRKLTENCKDEEEENTSPKEIEAAYALASFPDVFVIPKLAVVKEEKHPASESSASETSSNANSMEMHCHDCHQVFVRGSGDFSRHVATTKCKPYMCSICKKLFRKKSNLTSHSFTHSNEKFECFCGLVFKCSKYLENHQLRKHSGENNSNQAFDISKIIANLSKANENHATTTVKDTQIDEQQQKTMVVKREKIDLEEEPARKRQCISVNLDSFEKFVNSQKSDTSEQI